MKCLLVGGHKGLYLPRFLSTLFEIIFAFVVCRNAHLLWRVMNLFDLPSVFSTNHQTHHFILIGFADSYFTGFASTTHHDRPVRHSKDILHIVTNQDDGNALTA